MSTPTLNAKFFESTRGRIVELLRRANATVEELARELGVTDNAIRLQLGILERDGLVRSKGARREGAVGKPATEYEIDPSAEPAFSRAYIPFLSTLLTVLGARLSVRELRALMRDVGHRLAGETSNDTRTLSVRTAAASQLLNDLGGVTTVDAHDDGGFTIRGCGCPLSVAVSDREEVCLAVQTMLGDITGAEVREQCDRSARPQCRFEIVKRVSS